MSEEILKALMQLFALIVKQDDGVEVNEVEYVRIFLKQQVNDDDVAKYFALFSEFAELDKISEPETENSEDEPKKKKKLTSVKDSVRVLGICKKINKTLTQKQKVVVLVRMNELINAGNKQTEQRIAIIDTASEVFNISKDDNKLIERFIKDPNPETISSSSILVINDNDTLCDDCRCLKTESLDGNILILQILNEDLYFLRYAGKQDLLLNGLPINNQRIYLFANGSTIKLPKGKPIYYSDVIATFLSDKSALKISFSVKDISYKFKKGNLGLRNINFSENQGRLISIMGASGAGKTTLLNVLSGIETPTSGDVLINGVNLHTDKKKIEGVIGYIPQDDLLIEELTVFQNLYYNAKLCFKNKTESELTDLANKTLINLGLAEISHLKVGSPLNKTISGGQRKRLNIALELIREPAILFVDEPTSGLSSRDSENVMDLLRELSLKGKLIFVVIHQPSSDIYKMFDRVIILDTGGYMIYIGNPVEAVMYFKRIDNQINSEQGECAICGNVNPETIFNIIEARIVDEFGKYTINRKVTPKRWEERFKENIIAEQAKIEEVAPPASLNIPSKIKQLRIYTVRDFLSKVSNTQYVLLNLLEAPLLGLILSYIIRYIADPASDVYIFRDNENIPPYIFMCIIVSLFLGLTVSAEEIFRDRKILKREAFLNLSKQSYLISKIGILFLLSALQTVLFVLVGNSILGIKEMYFDYWFALFTVSCFANVLGLNISASFNSAVTIYILIPLLLIPQMILGGAMFSFDKLNRKLGTAGTVPFVAEFMPSKWVYESLLVNQFKNNGYEKYFYEIEKKESKADFYQVYYIPELKDITNECLRDIKDKSDSSMNVKHQKLDLLRNEIEKLEADCNIHFGMINKLHADSFNSFVAFIVKDYLDNVTKHYRDLFKDAYNEKETLINYWLTTQKDLYRSKKDAYFNESVADIAKKVYEKNKIMRYNNELIQQIDPVFQDPIKRGYFNFRSHFFAPHKNFMDKSIDTYWFNLIVVWSMTIFLYIALSFDLLKKTLVLSERFKKVKNNN
ncbi:MAG: ABC transporter [Bacteroidetes bacterium GWA2_31_9]|nr:MAG: ABC transporter [Bacteroidetes bacterium GWA2_31_9]